MLTCFLLISGTFTPANPNHLRIVSILPTLFLEDGIAVHAEGYLAGMFTVMA